MDSEKHRALWNTVVAGASTDDVTTAGKLCKLGKMSEKTFQIFVLTAAMATAERKEGKSK